MDEPLVNRPPISERQPVSHGTGVVDLGALPGLRRRLLGADDVDPQLDADIAHALGHGVDFRIARYTQTLHPAIRWSKPHPYAGEVEPCPKLTLSVDDVLALAGNTPGVNALGVLRRALARVPDEPFWPSRIRLPRLMLAEMLADLEAFGQ